MRVIWTLKVRCLFCKPEASHLIEIDSMSSLFYLHMAIQDALDFDNDHLYEFFAGRSYRHMAIEYAGMPVWSNRFVPDKVFNKIAIADVWPLPDGLKLFYHFDFGDDWYFQINKTRRKDKVPEPGVKYPRVVESRGPVLIQYPDCDDDDGDEDEE
ncbi:hypothetical protein JW905_07860 [bacterium]|nr:hypothetical protein [candidate division CSSED10-310 bacterium]